MKNWTQLLLMFAMLIPFPLSAQTEAYQFPIQRQPLADDWQIAYSELGDGEQTWVFIHGLGSYSPAWNRNLEAFSQHARCIAIDLPGYGQSTQRAHAGSMDWYADRVLEFLDSMEIESPVLFGHSMGGQIAVTVALKQPERIQQLVLVAPAGFETFTEQEGAAIMGVTTPEMVEATPESQIRINFGLNFSNMPEDVEAMIQDRFALKRTSDFKAYTQVISNSVKGMLGGPVFDRLGALKIPVLAVYGAEDQLIPNRYLHPTLTTEQVGQAGVDALGDGTLVMLPNAGHFAMYEQAAAFEEAVLEFLISE
ncbi:alpha/beta fold hydrolase [Pontibacter sp. G13]|uniref:alpha/beta fold hydrolase n=1 Tax=Pontibacter sp. G13 TaxID=3074898 RepID=UPI00288AB971|nr:alpha/beta fold hydrolase [Pontibacter sp. G13]WNJ20466.1 alpha/beta fold hydrolase [Pontibacter sp. G13]